MGKTSITFGDTEVEKHKFHQYKNPISICNVSIDKIVVSNKVLFGKKGFRYFIGYEDDHAKVMPLCIVLPIMSAYRKDFDETKHVSFLLEKHSEIWDKVSEVMKKVFDSEPAYNEKHLKTKIKSYEVKVNQFS